MTVVSTVVLLSVLLLVVSHPDWDPEASQHHLTDRRHSLEQVSGARQVAVCCQTVQGPCPWLHPCVNASLLLVVKWCLGRLCTSVIAEAGCPFSERSSLAGFVPLICNALQQMIVISHRPGFCPFCHDHTPLSRCLSDRDDVVPSWGWENTPESVELDHPDLFYIVEGQFDLRKCQIDRMF